MLHTIIIDRINYYRNGNHTHDLMVSSVCIYHFIVNKSTFMFDIIIIGYYYFIDFTKRTRKYDC